MEVRSLSGVRASGHSRLNAEEKKDSLSRDHLFRPVPPFFFPIFAASIFFTLFFAASFQNLELLHARTERRKRSSTPKQFDWKTLNMNASY